MRERRIEKRIRRLMIRREELMSCLYPGSMRYDVDRVQESPDDRMAAVFAEVDDLDRKIGALLVEKATAVIEVGHAIETLEDENEKDVLSMFFIERRSTSEIAEEKHYSVRQIQRLRKRGVEKMSHNVALCRDSMLSG